ncbi:TrmH family RNA methyltransferase, partial [Campylobacter sp.]
RRAGLDYWASLEPIIWESLEDFLEANLEFKDRFFFATTKCNKLYFDAKFAPGDYLIFGAEDCGLPIELMKLNKNNCITIPMTKQGRSLNLATSVGIITYEAIRQNVDKFDFRDSVCEF